MIKRIILSLATALSLSGCISLSDLSSNIETGLIDPKGMKVAAALLKNGDAGTAAGIYEKLLNDQPTNEDLLYGHATAIYEQGKYRDALIAYEKLNAETGGNCDAFVGMGNSHLKLGRPTVAGSFFAQCLMDENDHEVALLGRAISFDAIGKSNEALAFYQKAISQNPQDLGLRNNYGLSLLMAGQAQAAINEFGKIAFSEFSTVQMRQNLALAYAMAGDTGAAEKVAGLDLSSQRVANNMKIYEYVRNLPGNEALKSLIFQGIVQ